MAVDTAQQYALMYNALAGQLGGLGDQNLQLILPTQTWNWSERPVGQTDSREHSFLDALPYYSPVGQYQSGRSFADSYQAWLNALVVAADPDLRNRITQQSQVLQKANNDRQQLLRAAREKYDAEVPNQNPPFIDWLNDPYSGGSAFQSPLESARRDVLKQQEILTDLIDQSDDKQIKTAQNKFRDERFRTGVVSDRLPDPVPRPAYKQVENYATWVQQNASQGSTTVTWNQSSATSKFESNWAKAQIKIPRFFWSVYVNGEWRELKTSSSQSSLSFSLTFNPWGRVDVQPEAWFDEGIVAAKIRNPDAYRSGYSVNKPASGQGAWILGPGGILPARLTTVLVAYQPEVAVELASGFTKSEHELLKVSSGVRIGPFSFGGSGGHETGFNLEEASSTTFRARDTSTFPKLFGILVQDFGKQS